MKNAYWPAGLLAVVVVAAFLRLPGIGNPIMDHPGWRQGDTAAIARNFARREYNVMRPQTLYNGPPPNYVELELQIVPFAAASLDKAFGVREIFGRLVTLAFSLGTVVLVALFGRWLFGSKRAGLLAGFFYAVFPGSVYYGRTFMPDTAMVFFLTAALYAAARMLLATERPRARFVAGTALLLTLAYLAKPVAVLAFIPLLGLLWERSRSRKPEILAAAAALAFIPLALLWLYDREVASYAEWHWASGITRLHVLPSLARSFTNLGAFGEKFVQARIALGMLRDTMLGRVGFVLSLAGFVALPWVPARSKTLVWTWLCAALLYLFVVVTVERVDYYLYPFLPLCALVAGGALARVIRVALEIEAAPAARYALLAVVPIAALAALLTSRAAVAAYYDYNRDAYRNARELATQLDPGALVVIGHYGPDVQYYIDRFGWEEDPLLWTPFDEESAIRKGARYFISIEDGRLHRNLELCAWLARFPVDREPGRWPVYHTSPQLMLAGAESFWRGFRTAERAGRGRAFLDAHDRCRVTVARLSSSPAAP